MPGLSSSARAGSVGGASGRAALARVGRAGSFLECLAGSRGGLPFGAFGGSGAFAIAEIWRLAYDGKRAELPIVIRIRLTGIAVVPAQAGTHIPEAGGYGSPLARGRQVASIDHPESVSRKLCEGRTRCATHKR